MTQFVRAATTKLTADKRKAIAIQALARSASISALAADNGVSRPLIYREDDKARAALDDAFSPTQTDDADKVIFMLPVTRRWLDQTMLGLTQIARASFRGVIEFMHDILGISVSLGTVHNVHQWAAQRARAINDNIDLSTIRVGLHDEIFQGSQPVLVGVDVGSTYCYLLAPEAHRDGDTWAIHLLDLQKQGLVPEYTIADAGTGLRAGQRIVWPDTPCHGDVFHILQQFKALANIRTGIASGTRSRREELETRLANPRRRCEDSLLVATLEALHREEAREHQLASDLRTLAQWLERDILSLAGPDAAQRQMLYDFVVDELLQRESEDLSRIGALRRALQNQQDNCSPSCACLTKNSTPSHATKACLRISCARPAYCIASRKHQPRSGKAGTGCLPPWAASFMRSTTPSHKPCRTRRAVARWLKTSTHARAPV